MIFDFILWNSSFHYKTLTRLCVEYGQIESLDILLQHGARSKNLIRSAVRKSQIEVIKYLLSKGFNIEETSPDVPSPLMTAIIEKKVDIVKLLLDNGADPSETGDIQQYFIKHLLHIQLNRTTKSCLSCFCNLMHLHHR